MANASISNDRSEGSMTRLTLEWHLRGIIEGPTASQDEIVGYEEVVGKEYPIREQVDDGSYTTGFTQESGRFCDAYDVPAWEALNSDDPVQYLDAVAHDPLRRFQERNDAATLLNYHIWPESPDTTNTFANAERDDIDVSEWINAGMTAKSIGPTYFPMRCVKSGCMEGECLADPDILRDEGVPVCMVCGTEQPIPDYP